MASPELSWSGLCQKVCKKDWAKASDKVWRAIDGDSSYWNKDDPSKKYKDPSSMISQFQNDVLTNFELQVRALFK